MTDWVTLRITECDPLSSVISVDLGHSLHHFLCSAWALTAPVLSSVYVDSLFPSFWALASQYSTSAFTIMTSDFRTLSFRQACVILGWLVNFYIA
jgi:hypothetical protein